MKSIIKITLEDKEFTIIKAFAESWTMPDEKTIKKSFDLYSYTGSELEEILHLIKERITKEIKKNSVYMPAEYTFLEDRETFIIKGAYTNFEEAKEQGCKYILFYLFGKLKGYFKGNDQYNTFVFVENEEYEVIK